MKKTISILSLLVVFFSATQVSASTYVCRQNLENSMVRVIVVGSVFMVCESPSHIDLNQPGMKNKFCAASLLAVTSELTNTVNGTESTSVSGVTGMSALNSVQEGLNIEFSIQKTQSGATGSLVLSNGNISQSPSISIPLETSNYSCSIR